MAQLSPFVEHLLRRAGFRRLGSRTRAVFALHLSDRRGGADELQSGRDGRRRQDRHARLRLAIAGRAFSPNTGPQRRAPALAVPDGAFAGAAAGEDGAHLAPSLRDGVQQDLRPRRRGRRDADDGGQAVRGSGAACAGRSSCSASTRSAISATCWSRSPKIRRCSYWLDGRLNASGAAAGELRPRADGAVHVRRRALRRDGRVRRGARVHRLEPARDGHARHRRRQLRSSTTTPTQHDTEREGLQLPDLPRTAAGAFEARSGRRAACRTASI